MAMIIPLFIAHLHTMPVYILFVFIFILQFWIPIQKCIILSCNFIVTDCFFVVVCISVFASSNYRWLLKFMSLKMICTFHRKWYAMWGYFCVCVVVYILKSMLLWVERNFSFDDVLYFNVFAFFFIVSFIFFSCIRVVRFSIHITKEYFFYSNHFF